VATRPEGRFAFVFTPKHGSWLNLIEGFFSKLARSMLRHIRVASKDELKRRILAYLDYLTVTRSFTPGPIRSARRHDRSRFMETMN
jgi:transposase